MGGVVWADEEVTADTREPLDALGEDRPYRCMVPGVPSRHAAAHGDAIQAHIGMLMIAELLLPVAGDRLEALRRPRHAVGQDSDVSHPSILLHRPEDRSMSGTY